MKYLLSLVLVFVITNGWTQTLEINLKTMTYRQAYDYASAELAGGRELSPGDLAQLPLLAKGFHDTGDAELARQTELLIAANKTLVDRAEGHRSDAVAQIWAGQQEASSKALQNTSWRIIRDWSLGLTLASAASSIFFWSQADYASQHSGFPYYQRLEDNSKAGATISLTAFGVFFLALFDSQNHL